MCGDATGWSSRVVEDEGGCRGGLEEEEEEGRKNGQGMGMSAEPRDGRALYAPTCLAHTPRAWEIPQIAGLLNMVPGTGADALTDRGTNEWPYCSAGRPSLSDRDRGTSAWCIYCNKATPPKNCPACATAAGHNSLEGGTTPADKITFPGSLF